MVFALGFVAGALCIVAAAVFVRAALRMRRLARAMDDAEARAGAFGDYMVRGTVDALVRGFGGRHAE